MIKNLPTDNFAEVKSIVLQYDVDFLAQTLEKLMEYVPTIEELEFEFSK